MKRPAEVTQLMKVWRLMLRRCYVPGSGNYQRYGGRGIYVCDRWQSFENFRADMGLRPAPGLSIDRVDTNGPYRPENCRWADAETQSRNRRNARFVELNGELIRLCDAAALTGIRRGTILKRARAGRPIDRAA